MCQLATYEAQIFRHVFSIYLDSELGLHSRSYLYVVK